MAMFSEWRQICRRVFSWQQAGVFLILSAGLTLATVMFAIGHGYSSNSLPYKDAERLVMVGRQSAGNMTRLPTLSLYTQSFNEWRQRGDLFTGMAAFTGHESWRLHTPNGNIMLRGIQATPNFFDVLGVWFPEIEIWKRSNGTQNLSAIVLTHGVGMEKFGREVIGQIFRTLEGGGIIVEGILPANFAFPNEDMGGNTQECGVIAVPAEDISTNSSYLRVIGRLAPGITPQNVEQALSYGPDEEKIAAVFGKITVIPLTDIMTESSRPIVLGSWALGGLVLILCSANLSGILLVRCCYRLREYAIRTAIGATFLDLVRLLLMELAAVSIIAAGVSWFAGRAVVSIVSGMVPAKYLSFGRPVFGWDETTFLIAVTVAVALLSALASLVVIGSIYLRGFSLDESAVFYSQKWLRMLLTTGQVAIAMLLLSLSYMTVRGYLDIFTRNVGLDTDVRVVSVRHSSAGKPVLENTLTALRGGDPSAAVSAHTGRMFNTFFSTSLFDTSSAVARTLTQDEIASIDYATVSPGFFRTAKVRILSGREFDDRDHGDEVLINATFVRRMGWSPSEAVGQILNSNMVVIGVVDDFPVASWDEATLITYFRPLNWWLNRVRNSGATINYIIHPEAISRTGNVEQAILGVDPGAVIERNVTWSDLLNQSVRGQAFATISVSSFTIAAIVIVVIGISNTVMYIVSVRRNRGRRGPARRDPARLCWRSKSG